MASSKAPSPTFTDADVRRSCLLKINTELREPLFRQLHPWVNPQWNYGNEGFATYLVRQNMITREEDFKGMNRDQKISIQTDPSGRYWDVSLLFWVVQNYNTCLLDKKNQDAWTKESDDLEYFITQVKNDRNKLGHMTKQLNETTFKEWCKSSRDNMIDLLSRVRQRCPHVAQKEIDEWIAKVQQFVNQIMNSPIDGSGFDPLKYEEYKKKMAEHKECVITMGKEDLKVRHRKRNCLDVTSYLALKKDLPIEDTFVDMILDKGVSDKEVHVEKGPDKIDNDKENHIEAKNLIDGSTDLYYLEGRAGAGKTSLMKYYSMAWTNEEGEIKSLEEYDLFLHMSCRDHHITSFNQLLALSMPTVLDRMSIDTLLSSLYGLRSIIVFDGYDEKNEKSAQVLSEVLALKKDYNFTVLVTSRPEATKQFQELANSHGIHIKHVKVLGIPKSKRADFLHKYAHSMDYRGDIEPLLKYVERTELRLSDLWELPYNLSILAILWMNNPFVINSITTSLELHWQMHQTYKSKLKQRLLNYCDTNHLPPSVVDRKVEDFMYVLCEISLTALANNDITLPNELYERLLNKCECLEIPTEEMLGAFLKPFRSETETRYSYPHKGVLDFLAAFYIYKKLDLVSNFDIDRIKERLMNDLAISNAPEDIRQDMKAFFEEYKVKSDLSRAIRGPSSLIKKIKSCYGVVKQKLTSGSSKARGPPASEGGKIRKLLDEITGGISDDDLSKYHNILLTLLGILYLEEKTGGIYDETKIEVLELLRDTGVKGKDHWLRLLNDVKCDEFVTDFISQETDILNGKIEITDGNIFAYMSLLKAMKSPLTDESLKIHIDVKECISEVGEFISLVNEYKLQVTQLKIRDSKFEEYSSMFTNIKSKFVNPENIFVILRMEKERQSLFNIRKALRKNGLHIRDLSYHCDHYSSLPAAMNFEDSDIIDEINEILPSCEEYVGLWSHKLQLHSDMKTLRVRLLNSATFDAFFASLTSRTELKTLEIYFAPCINPTITSIPDWVQTFEVYIPEMKTEEDSRRASDIIRRFDRPINDIWFPRCVLGEDEMMRLLDSLSGVTVTRAIAFPENLRPDDGAKVSELDDKAKALGCPYRILWSDFSAYGW